MDPYSIDPDEDPTSSGPKDEADATNAGDIDLYAVLNLRKDASEEDIKAAYKRMVMTFHPDKHHRQEDKVLAERQFQMIQRAYDVLSNAERRQLYDTFGAESLTTNWQVGPRLRTPDEVREEYQRLSTMRMQNEIENLIKSKGELLIGIDASALFDPFDKLPKRRVVSRAPQIPGPRSNVGGGSISGVGQHLGVLGLFRIPTVRQAVVKHSWETKVAQQTDLILSGSATARNGIGSGSVVGTLRHVVTPTLWGELSASLGQHSSTSIKVVNNFTPEVFGTIHAQCTTLDIPPPITVSVGRRLTEKTTGFITFRTGEFALGPWGADSQFTDFSSCALGIIRKHESSQMTFDVSAGEASSHISSSYVYNLKNDLRIRFTGALGTSLGLQASVSAVRKMSQNEQFGVGVECGSVIGVVFRIRYIRLGQKFSVPIIISPQLDLQLAMVTAAVPATLGLLLDWYIFEPWRQRRHLQKLEEIKSQNSEVLAERKRNAEDAVRLMADQVRRKIEVEEQKSGLVIISAIYGKLPPSKLLKGSSFSRSLGGFKNLFTSDQDIHIPSSIGRDDSFDDTTTPTAPGANTGVGADPYQPHDPSLTTSREWIDVTVPVQNLCHNSTLFISGGHSKAHLLGFHDPCLGEQKRLRITYKFKGGIHVVEVDDLSSVAAPIRGR